MTFSEILQINPMCQINHFQRENTLKDHTYKYKIIGFIDLDTSFRIDDDFYLYHFYMEDKTFHLTFTSSDRIFIEKGKCMTLNDLLNEIKIKGGLIKSIMNLLFMKKGTHPYDPEMGEELYKMV